MVAVSAAAQPDRPRWWPAVLAWTFWALVMSTLGLIECHFEASVRHARARAAWPVEYLHVE